MATKKTTKSTAARTTKRATAKTIPKTAKTNCKTNCTPASLRSCCFFALIVCFVIVAVITGTILVATKVNNDANAKTYKTRTVYVYLDEDEQEKTAE